MTVVEDQPDTPGGVDLEAAGRRFTEIYEQYRTRLRSFIWRRLDLWQEQLAEDLTQETFFELWRLHLLKGRDPEKPYGLLCTMARSQIGQHFQCKKNTERALDFTDPANTPIIATGHAYALETPGLTELTAGLDVAMDDMTAASKSWRDKHKDSHRLRSLLDDDYNVSRGGLTTETKEELAKRLELADAEEVEALKTFRGTCRRVGELRAEIEGLAGPNWRSVIGLPINPEITSVRKGVYRNDLSVTHCPDGHLLDLNNTTFGEDGSRKCRACRNADYAAGRDAAPKGKTVSTVSAEKIAAARTLLADPANAHRSIASIAKELGISSTTIHKRIPDVAELRRKHAKVGAGFQSTLERARRMLLDPNGTLGLHEIAAELGIAYTTIKNKLPEEAAVCRARLLASGVDAEALERARRMLLDPNGTLGLHEIAAELGIHYRKLQVRLPQEVATCQARKEARRIASHRAARAMLRDPECGLTLAAIANFCGFSPTHLRRILPDEVAAYRARQQAGSLRSDSEGVSVGAAR
ncbi:MAG: hypothetical protein HOY76_08465 [Streptomyces sp.]|nr:hypothetical protein [Streptomyces sp.]